MPESRGQKVGKVGEMGTVVMIMTRNNWSDPMSAVETPSRPMAVTRCRRMAGLGARASASQRAMRESLQSFPCPGRSGRSLNRKPSGARRFNVDRRRRLLR